MALYNKDGSVYRLSSPNPVMKQQSLWNDFVVHNMTWKHEISEDKRVISPLPPKSFVQDSFLGALKTAKDEIKVVEMQSFVEPKVVEMQPIEQNEPIKEEINVIEKHISEEIVHSDSIRHEEIEKIFVYCLPAQIRERRDSLYNESYKTIKYENPTSFEAVVISQDDFLFKIWTDFDKIGVGSVLYPKTQYKRWWRVQEKIQKNNGWILTSLPSDFQPSFES